MRLSYFRILSLILVTQFAHAAQVGSPNTVYRMGASGLRPAFGQVDISQSTAVKNILDVGHGGLGVGTIPTGSLLLGTGSAPVTGLSPSAVGTVQATGSTFTVIPGQVVPSGAGFVWFNATCPTGSHEADGSSQLRSGTFANAFAAFGTRFGTVDGTHFNLPDLRGLFPRGDTASMAGGTISALSSNNVTVTGHGLNHTGVPVQITGTPPTGLSTSTTYFVIFVDANTIAFASSLTNALAGTKISISGSPSGTVTQWQDPDANTRTVSSLGGDSVGVGSLEQDQFASHVHQYTLGTPVGNAQGGGGASGIATTPGTNTSATGGNETRSKNLAVLYCVEL